MIRKDLNIRKIRKNSNDELEQERSDRIKCIRESDLDDEAYMAELKKIKEIGEIIDKDKKPKMDGQTKAAIIKGVFSLVAIAGIVVYENREVIHSKLGMNIATRGI